MIENIRGFPLLAGYRGSPPVDRGILEESLLRLSQLSRDFDEIVEFDVNPFSAGAERGSSFALDARILLGDR
jgi:acetyltransferase